MSRESSVADERETACILANAGAQRPAAAADSAAAEPEPGETSWLPEFLTPAPVAEASVNPSSCAALTFQVRRPAPQRQQPEPD